MEAIKLTTYKNWSIKIECEHYDNVSRPAAYSSIAVVTYIGRNPLTKSEPCECFVASLPGTAFSDSHEANLAIQQEAMRRIDA